MSAWPNFLLRWEYIKITRVMTMHMMIRVAHTTTGIIVEMRSVLASVDTASSVVIPEAREWSSYPHSPYRFPYPTISLFSLMPWGGGPYTTCTPTSSLCVYHHTLFSSLTPQTPIPASHHHLYKSSPHHTTHIPIPPSISLGVIMADCPIPLLFRAWIATE